MRSPDTPSVYGVSKPRRTEREGYLPPTSAQVADHTRFSLIILSSQKLRNSGHSWLLLVIPRPAGARPGQKRDNLYFPNRGRRRILRRRRRAAIYARYSTKHQDSIEDQVRTCREFAEVNDLDVPDELIFVDRGKGGGRRRREGMDALLQALENNEFGVLLVFKTSRLNRKLYRTLAFVEEEIVSRSKRCVFVKSGIDTDDRTSWRSLLQVHGMVDELSVQMGAEHIRAAHVGLLEQELVFGSISFGYTGEPIPGQTNRANKPRRNW